MTRILRPAVLAALVLLALAPAVRADEVKKFEGSLAAPGADLAGVLADEFACPEPGEADGSFYKFFDLEGEYTFFRASGPTPLYTDPTGIVQWGDYDLDLYVYDAECKQLPDANGPAATEKLDTKRPARYAVVHYYYGIHANLPITLEASNSSIK